MIEKEARATVDKTIEMGDGDLLVGIVKAIGAGVLDTIYSPYHLVKKDVLLVRDNHGAIRYLKHGNLPLPKEVIEYNQERIAEREKVEGTKADIDMVINDTIFPSRHFTELVPAYK
jgi:methylaspartate mutase epsilon subunit